MLYVLYGMLINFGEHNMELENILKYMWIRNWIVLSDTLVDSVSKQNGCVGGVKNDVDH